LVPGFGATEAEKKKFQKYIGRYGEDFRSHLVPFGIEATGRLGPEATKFLEDLTKDISDNDAKKEVQKARALLARRMAATLVIYNGSLLSAYRRHGNHAPIFTEDENYDDPFVAIPEDQADTDEDN
jgi:hypothetical protein